MDFMRYFLIITVTLSFLWNAACSTRIDGNSTLDRGESCPKIVSDSDGNQYSTVTIAKQCWILENVKSLHYNDGSKIEDVYAYDNDEKNVSVYGRLYTWKAATASKICPKGFHVPSDVEWKELEIAVGMQKEVTEETGWRHSNNESRKLKMFDNAIFWDEESKKNVNISGFSAIPGGVRMEGGSFTGLGSYADYWSSSEYDSEKAYNRSLVWIALHPGSDEVYRKGIDKKWGFSIRCIQD